MDIFDELATATPTPAIGKVTDYGQANDPWRDTNSLNRIGAWDNPLTDTSLAVSPDIEQQFRKAGIAPNQPVKLLLADGSEIVRTWDDRTATDRQAAELGLKPLRGRFDFFSPQGPHEKRDVRVIGFTTLDKEDQAQQPRDIFDELDPAEAEAAAAAPSAAPTSDIFDEITIAPATAQPEGKGIMEKTGDAAWNALAGIATGTLESAGTLMRSPLGQGLMKGWGDVMGGAGVDATREDIEEAREQANETAKAAGEAMRKEAKFVRANTPEETIPFKAGEFGGAITPYLLSEATPMGAAATVPMLFSGGYQGHKEAAHQATEQKVAAMRKAGFDEAAISQAQAEGEQVAEVAALEGGAVNMLLGLPVFKMVKGVRQLINPQSEAVVKETVKNAYRAAEVKGVEKLMAGLDEVGRQTGREMTPEAVEGMARAFEWINKEVGKGVADRLKTIVLEGAKGGGIGGGVAVANNAIARQYNPDQPLTAGAAESAIGFGLMSGTGSAANQMSAARTARASREYLQSRFPSREQPATLRAGGSARGRPSTPEPAPSEPPSPAQREFESQIATQDSVVRGGQTVVLGTKGQEFPATYAWIPREQIQPSHTGEMLSPNPAYPLTNTRDYTDQAEKDKALSTRNEWDPRRAITDSPDAAVGPPIVARVIDENGIATLATAGGNNRQWAMSQLPPEKWEETAALSKEKAAQFGLGEPPDDQHQIARFLGTFDFRNPGERDRLQGMVDALNPSPGMIQGTAKRAEIDVANVPPETVAGLPMDISPADAQTFVRQQINAGTLDRNLTMPIAESKAQSQDYVQRLVINAGFRQPAIAEVRNDPRAVNTTVRGWIDAAAPALVQLRARGDDAIADSIARAFTTTLSYMGQDGSGFKQALERTAQQAEMDPSHAAAQDLARAMAGKVVTDKAGKVQAEPTIAKLQDMFDDLAIAAKTHNPEPDIFGQAETLPEVVQRIASHHAEPAGEQLRVAEEPGSSAPIELKGPEHLAKILDAVEARKIAGSTDVRLGWTPAVLRKLGAPDLRMNVRAAVLDKGMHKHQLTKEEIVAALQGRDTPMLVLRNPSPDGVSDVVIYPGASHAGQPILIGLKFGREMNRIFINDIATVHPKRRFADDLENWHQQGLVLHTDKKLSDWFRELTGRQLPGMMNQSDNPNVGEGPPIVKEQLELQLAHKGVPAEKIPEAIDGITRTLSLAADPQLAIPYEEPPLLHGSGGKGVAAAKDAGAGERETRGIESERRRNRAILEITSPAAVANAFRGGDTISAILPQLITGETPVFNIVGKVIASPADFAILTQALRTPYFESLKAASLDANGKVISSQILSIGDLSEAMVPMGAVTRFATLAKQRGARSIIISHNHPSSDPTPSDADRNMTDRVHLVLQAVGIRLKDHIITDGPRFYSFAERDYRDVSSSPAPWEAVGREHLQFVLDNKEQLAAVAGALRQGDPGHSHVIYVNTKYKVNAVERMPMNLPMDEFRRRVMEGVAREGAFGVALDLPSAPVSVAQTLVDYVREIKSVRVIDVTTPDVPSFHERALLREGSLYRRPGQQLREQAEALRSLAEQPADYSPMQIADAKGSPYAPVPLQGLADIKIVQMPEMVQLARAIMGELPSLKKLPKARGYFKPIANGRIVLDPRIFADPTAAAKTMAHEIGHLIDWLPDQTLKRGNLLGRLHTLRQFMKERYGVSGITNKVYREELLDLSQYWKPWDPATVPEWYDKYRRSAIELYADAVSVLFNSPATLKERAPKFYREFFRGLNTKPEIKRQFFELQAWLNRPAMAILKDRSRSVHEWFGKAEEIFERKMAERELRYKGYSGWLDRLKQGFFDTYSPILSRAAKSGDAPMARATKFFFDSHPLSDNRVYRWLERMHRTVIEPLESAGLTMDDLGESLFFSRIANERYEVARRVAGEMQIETGGRSVIANPGGHTPDTARLGLLRQRLEHGIKATTLLDAAKQKFHDEVFGLMKEAHEAGLLTDAQMQLIAENRDNYATFVPLEYVDTFVPSGIFQQVGTLKEIENPFIGTVLKAITMHRAIELNRAKRIATDVLLSHFPGEVEKAITTRDAKGREHPRPPRDKHQSQLMLKVAGKPAWYNVPREIGEMFETVDMPLLKSVMDLMDVPFRKFFYQIWITFNPLFQVFRNPIRDARRSFVNAPDQMLNTIMQGVRPEIARWVKAGEMTPLIADMLANFAITPVEQGFYSGTARSDAFGAMLRQFDILPPAERSKLAQAKILEPVMELGDWLRNIGRINEVLPKAGAYKMLVHKLGWDRADAAFYVRNYIGTPNHLKKGKYIWLPGTIFPFLNIWTKGWAADLELMRKGYTRAAHPDQPGKSSASWWYRWMMTSGVPLILKTAGTLGLLGAGMKELYDRIGSHDLTNYDVVPLGTLPGKDGHGKTLFVPLPKDPTDRVLSGIAYNLLTYLGKTYLTNEPTDAGQMLGANISAAGSDVPGLNPVLKLAGAWSQYLQGQNPMDDFRHRPVLTNDEFLVGGWDSLSAMLGWSYKQTGLQTFVHYDGRTDSTAEFTLGSIPLLNGALKVSDYGLREKQQAAEKVLDQQTARVRLSLSDEVRGLLQERGYLASLHKENREPAQAMRLQQLNQWYYQIYKPTEEQILMAQEAGHSGDDARAALNASSRPYQPR
jgi:proteasome lid subunit RPN8/RPN11